MALNPLTDTRLQRAKEMLDGGASVNQVVQETGLARPTVYKYFGKPDPKPGGGGRPRSKKPVTTDEQLTRLFSKVAVAPAIPMGIWVRCDFCAQHFTRTGPDAAAKLVELSNDHPALRSVMESLYRYADEVAWAGILATWIGVPVCHHLAPDFIYKWLQLPLNMPPRGAPAHAPGAPATNGATSEAPSPMPFAGMDMESILRMAESMGIKIELPTEPVTDAPTAEQTATEPESAATTPEDEPQTVASDSDAAE